jgi:serine/threonine-protein kinase
LVQPAASSKSRSIGRYLLCEEIASGGMATVHLGRLSGAAGFSRTVAIKCLLPNLARDPEFVAMFLDEARLAARIRHPNVVPTLDVVAMEGEIFLVMEYVQGESLGKLRKAMDASRRLPSPRVVASVMSGVLHGLHAAHEAKSEQGESLNIVHRDVSPQNVLVGTDGIARVFDFGVAKAIGRVQTTREGQLKGKIAYMPPEQLRGGHVTRQTDVYAAAVVAWEMLTAQRLFAGESEGALVAAVLMQPVPLPSQVAPQVGLAFDRVIMRGLSRDPAQRYATAREMALDLERCAGIASPSEVGEWVEGLARDELAKRAALIAEIEGATPARAAERANLPPSEPRQLSSATVTDVKPLTSTDQPTRLSGPPPSLRQAPELRSGVSQVAIAPIVALVDSRKRVLALSVTVALGLALALSLAMVLGRRAIARHAPEVAASIGVPPTESIPQPAAEAASSPTESVPPGMGVARSPSAAPEQGGDERPAASTSAHPAISAPRSPRSNRPVRRDCDPPFTIDEKGHKHYKAACL